jgi:hypothetical protein
MPSPYPFLNLGKAAARRAVKLSENKASRPRLEELPQLSQSFSGKGGLIIPGIDESPRFGLSDFERNRSFINDQIRIPLIERYGTAPPEMALGRVRGGQADGEMAVIVEEFEEGMMPWFGPLSRLGLQFLARITPTRARPTGGYAFLMPEDPILGSGLKFGRE